MIPFLAFPTDVRRVVYTTNTIEALHRQIRKRIKTRGHFPTEEAARKLICLSIINAQKSWMSRTGFDGGPGLVVHTLAATSVIASRSVCACSCSAGGMSPSDSCRRALLYQPMYQRPGVRLAVRPLLHQT